jgi:multidrug transporter EmrE-like cation transporter
MKHKDAISKWIGSINWKVGNFSFLPIFFGTIMALIDIGMMTTAKLISTGKITEGFGTLLGIGLYAPQVLVFIRAMDYEGMAVTNLIWNMISDIIVTLEGVIMFKESIKGMRWLGIIMSIFSLGLLAYTED